MPSFLKTSLPPPSMQPPDSQTSEPNWNAGRHGVRQPVPGVQEEAAGRSVCHAARQDSDGHAKQVSSGPTYQKARKQQQRRRRGDDAVQPGSDQSGQGPEHRNDHDADSIEGAQSSCSHGKFGFHDLVMMTLASTEKLILKEMNMPNQSSSDICRRGWSESDKTLQQEPTTFSGMTGFVVGKESFAFEDEFKKMLV